MYIFLLLKKRIEAFNEQLSKKDQKIIISIDAPLFFADKRMVKVTIKNIPNSVSTARDLPYTF